MISYRIICAAIEQASNTGKCSVRFAGNTIMARAPSPGCYPGGPTCWPGLLLGLATAVAVFAAGNRLTGTAMLHVSLGWAAVAVGQGAAIALLVLMTQEWHRFTLFHRDLDTFESKGRAPLVEQMLKAVMDRIGFARRFESLKHVVDQEEAVEQGKRSLQEECVQALSISGAEWVRNVERRWWLYLGLTILVFGPVVGVVVTVQMPRLSFSGDSFLLLDVATVEVVVVCLAGLYIRRCWFRLIADWEHTSLVQGVIPALSRVQFRPPIPSVHSGPQTLKETRGPQSVKTLPAEKPRPIPPPAEKPSVPAYSIPPTIEPTTPTEGTTPVPVSAPKTKPEPVSPSLPSNSQLHQSQSDNTMPLPESTAAATSEEAEQTAPEPEEEESAEPLPLLFPPVDISSAPSTAEAEGDLSFGGGGE